MGHAESKTTIQSFAPVFAGLRQAKHQEPAYFGASDDID
jgi:hypothetical protein